MSKPQTVAIIKGFAEGGYHIRKLRRALEQAGFIVVDEPTAADVIIAHSAGCYLVPAQHKAKVVLHIGYTYWPGRRLPDSLRANLAVEYRQFGLLTSLKLGIIGSFYAFNIQTWRMYRGWHNPGAFLDSNNPGRHIFIRNHHDAYCDPSQLIARAGGNHTYISLPGSHNHIWDEPTVYANLLQSVL